MADDDIFKDDSQNAKKHNKSRELELFSIRNIMKTENGRSFMWRCLQNCCTFVDTFNTDPSEHLRNTGKRSHGIWLDSELKEAATNDYFKMLKENYDG